MKRSFFVLALALASLAGCQQQSSPETAAAAAPDSKAAGEAKSYGEAITEADAQPLSALPTVLGDKDSAQVKLVGTITDVCQARGCWMKMQTADGKEMRVRFKDYAFFVPKDIKGKTAVIDGWVHREEVPVEDLQHYATDAGKSDKEIAAITKPEQQVNFEANGVLIKN
ncbi:DUF4920 domain-containing protein [Hymenobacter busanensis]|uniref:DUF4920 domain-containing protein n=1 Tax=Hymenobacter busanensis TaxID=2607656 RepID=A0A7L4ZT34_9BACT|nr:DUF4920 domain-containing protein [Hymenobacter busanensis]KAA9339737.1 DUF4920 domain-containing protein [Hymenobacter busanensis]QHJ06509.1 DUF4920 domain-containing protein [Hymenobacter busanensis]